MQFDSDDFTTSDESTDEYELPPSLQEQFSMANYAKNLARAHRILDLDLDGGHQDDGVDNELSACSLPVATVSQSADSESEERTLVINEGPEAGFSGITIPSVECNQGIKSTLFAN